MKLYAVPLIAILLLAACGKSEPPPAPPTQSAEAPPEIPAMGKELHVLALGDSLFAGYGLKSDQAYPVRLEVALRARGINARIANGGVSGNTSADGLARLNFTLQNQNPAPDLVLVEFGGNDMLRALPPEQTRANIDAILTELGKRGIPVVLMGMLAPPNLGADYRRKFDTIYPEMAKKHGAVLVPFFMQAVVDQPVLFQPDHLHPTEQGVEAIIAATIDQVSGALPKTEGAKAGAPPPPR